ncbi:hypothetical protein [Acutalibacter sp.]|jgi:hypothetical protein|uniref:hypothetical protein n=1 Tax=Acutalibacter sp. TaxID=1918636 RepID=UPI00216EA069|nr:hypothetical protein [Acutalibacter sp.]
MNAKVKSTFYNIQNRFNKYQRAVTDALEQYRQGMEAAKERSKAYKDEEGALKAEQEKLAAPARQAIAEADKALSDGLKFIDIPDLKEALSEYLCEKPTMQFMGTLNVYKDYGLSMSRMELDSLLIQSDGIYAALRAVASLAEKSGFRVSVPPVDQWQDEIETIERWTYTPLCYAPLEYAHEALEVMPQCPQRRHDGSIMYMKQSESLDFILGDADFDLLVASLGDAKERWATAFVPAVTAFEPKKDEDGEVITPEQQRQEAVKESVAQVVTESTEGEKLAREIGQDKAAAAQASKNISKFIIDLA